MAAKTLTEEAAPAVSLPPEILAFMESMRAEIVDLKAKLAEKPAAPALFTRTMNDAPRFANTDPSNQHRNEPTRGGRELSQGEARFFRPRFKDRQYVTIRRDATRDGAIRPWGEIIDQIGEIGCPTRRGNQRCFGRIQVGEMCRECGVGPMVLSMVHLMGNDVWKYRVHVPGLTRRNGDGFAEYELEPV